MSRISSVVVSSVVLAGGMCALWACESTPSAVAAEADSIKTLAGDWVLKSLGGKDFAQLVPQDVAVKKPTLDIANDGKVSGTTGVNRLTSSVDVPALMKGQFLLSPAATTRMAGPQYAMDLESKYLNALQKVRSFKLNGSTLTLTDGGNELMQLVRTE